MSQWRALVLAIVLDLIFDDIVHIDHGLGRQTPITRDSKCEHGPFNLPHYTSVTLSNLTNIASWSASYELVQVLWVSDYSLSMLVNCN